MSRFGIKVAEENEDIGGTSQLRLDSEKKQFKYRKIIDFKFLVPAISVGTDWSKTNMKLYFFEDQRSLGFVPAYEYYVKAWNGSWHIPVIASPQAYEASTPEAPFYKSSEFVTDKYMNISLFIRNQNLNPPYTPTMAYPAYEATLRLIITFDDLTTL